MTPWFNCDWGYKVSNKSKPTCYRQVVGVKIANTISKIYQEGDHLKSTSEILPKLTGPVSEDTDITPLLTAVILKLYVSPAVRLLMMVEVSFVVIL